MNVTVVQGDLLEQNVDAIVNAWNRNFIPWWLLLPQGVSGAIRRRAGSAPFREVGRAGILHLGQAILTSAGRLNFKGIIHVAGLNAFWRATDESICKSTRNAVALAASSGFESIAFPLIGAGAGGYKPAKAKDLMIQELKRTESAVRVTIVEYPRP